MTDKPISMELFTLQTAIEQRDREIEKLKAELKKTTAQLDETKASLKTADLRVHLSEAAMRAGVIPDAIPDIVRRAERDGEWDTDPKGRLRRKDEYGFFDQDADEWLRTVKSLVPSYFQDSALTEDPRSPGVSNSNGGSSGGSSGGGNGGAVETDPFILADFDPKTMNLTTVSVMYKKDPKRAMTIAKQVGNPIFENIQMQDRRFGR